MAHLTPARLVDLAEGAEAEHAVPHLAECDACRREVAELRATMADVGRAYDVPEPSPLFWDHLSARVRDGVAGAACAWRNTLGRTLVAAARRVADSRRRGWRRHRRRCSVAWAERADADSSPRRCPSGKARSFHRCRRSSRSGAADDPSLGLMADYGTALDWDDMREEMALVSRVGSTDEAVIALSAEERQELQRLLEEEMTQPSALGAS